MEDFETHTRSTDFVENRYQGGISADIVSASPVDLDKATESIVDPAEKNICDSCQ